MNSSEDGNNLEGNQQQWKPRILAFRPHVQMMNDDGRSSGSRVMHHKTTASLRVVVNKPMVVRLTKEIVETYQTCNPAFTYSYSFNPKSYLTTPSAGVLNDGFDNANSDLILAVNLVLMNSEVNRRYIVKGLLGQGTFGQVAKCWSPESNSFVAVKVIKNQPAYYHQALVEICILTMLNQKFDPEDKHHIVRILDHFVFQKHLCITFELLGVNLFDLLRMNQYKGVSLKLLRLFAKQILNALLVLREASVIHCDLKPENILLTTSVQLGEIKLIDFGSACMENRTVYSYIQSRFYRSPEVVLGHPYTTAIDMWSFGCIVAELFLGLPLFPGASEYDLIKRMIQILRDQPPDHMLRASKNTSKYFKPVGNSSPLGENQSSDGQKYAYHFLSEVEYETREMKKPATGKRYFNYDTLEEIVFNYPYRKKMTDEELAKENQSRMAFIDFLRGLVQFDPVKRWTPRQAAQHPFVTDEAFTCPFMPPPETPRTPVCQMVRVDHNPGAGHWFGAGLSPQVTNVNKNIKYNSPQYQMAPLSYASSYGSIGSHGSFGDGVGVGSSFGSYGDMSNKFMSYCSLTPSGINIQNQGSSGVALGASPDARWRLSQPPPGHVLGMSPSSGMLRPMSLGASPSQFTPPSSQMQGSAGSPVGSPGRYAPTSPARGGIHAAGLGKAAAVGQFNKRRGIGIPGNLHGQHQEFVSQPNQAPQKNMVASADASVTGSDGANRVGYVGSPRTSQLSSHFQASRQRCGSGMPISSSSSNPSKTVCSGALEAFSEGVDSNSSLPDPGDWDPNYSDELLLQEDGSEIISPKYASNTSTRYMQGSTSSSAQPAGLSRSGRNHSVTQATSSTNLNTHGSRSNGLQQGYGSYDGSPPVHAIQPGYGRAMSKPLHHGLYSVQQSSPSRLGQQGSHFFPQNYPNHNLPHSMMNANHRLQPDTVGFYPQHKNASMPTLPPPTGEGAQAERTQFPAFASGTVIGANNHGSHPQNRSMDNASQWPYGMRHAGDQSSVANEIPWGQKAGRPFTSFTSSMYGRSDYKRAG